MNRDARSHPVDVMRGVAILLVLFHHFNIAYSLKDTTLSSLLGWEAVRAVARNGNYGVTLFFVISGYLITSHALRRWNDLAQVRLSSFYILRAARILPCLLLLLLVVNVLAAAGMPMFLNRGFGEAPLPMWMVDLASLSLWMNVLIVNHGWVNYPLGVLWSLSVEETFYLAFPLLCLLLKREHRLLAFWGTVIVVGPLYRLMHQGDESGFLYASLACFDGIAIGCTAALLAERRAFPWLAGWPARIAVIGLMLWLYLGWPISKSNVLGVTAMSAGTAMLLLGWRYAPVQPGGIVGRAIAACGRLSYELYLFHLVILGLMRTAWPPATASGDIRLWLMAAYFVMSAATGACIARACSEPLNRVIRRRLLAE